MRVEGRHDRQGSKTLGSRRANPLDTWPFALPSSRIHHFRMLRAILAVIHIQYLLLP